MGKLEKKNRKGKKQKKKEEDNEVDEVEEEEKSHLPQKRRFCILIVMLMPLFWAPPSARFSCRALA